MMCGKVAFAVRTYVVRTYAIPTYVIPTYVIPTYVSLIPTYVIPTKSLSECPFTGSIEIQKFLKRVLMKCSINSEWGSII